MSKSVNTNPLTTQDTLSIILSFLPIRKLGEVARVCKLWSTVSSSDAVWRRFQLYPHAPTPSPIKTFTLMKFQFEALPYLTKMKQLKTPLPKYDTEFVQTAWSTPKEWEKFQDIPRLVDFTCNMNQEMTLEHMYRIFTLTVYSFGQCLLFSKIGLTRLEDAEQLALQTKDSFRNPYPFTRLEAEYRSRGNALKADEMQKIAGELGKRN